MSEPRELLERVGGRYRFPDDAFERMLRRRDRKRRNQRIVAGTVGVAVALVAIVIGTGVFRSSPKYPEPAATPATRNGPIEVFGYLNGVREFGRQGLGPFVAECSGHCTFTLGASWSPDGSRLAFSTSCGPSCASAGDPYHGIRIVDPTRGTDRLLLAGDEIYGVSWSPDGSRIAFNQQYYRDGMYVIAVDGETPTQILAFGPDRPYAIGTPSWSPDGSELTYGSTDGRMFIVGLDGGEPRSIGYGAVPAWSPNGEEIAYLDRCQIRMVAPDGSGDRLLVDLSTVRSDAAACDEAVDLTWSPDGSRLAALVTRNVKAPHIPSSDGLFVVRAAGGRARLYGSWGVNFSGIAWQPIP
jgi:dipeptidyl aminopeptidase/acylaminoacyl peptidase